MKIAAELVHLVSGPRTAIVVTVEESPLKCFPLLNNRRQTRIYRPKNLAWWIVGNWLSYVDPSLHFLVQMLLSRYLTPADYGLFGCFNSLCCFCFDSDDVWNEFGTRSFNC